MSGLSAFSNIISFGDSYTTVSANLHALLPSRTNPVAALSGGPVYGRNPASGPNWIYQLTQKSSLLAYDFAIGGATVDRHLLAPWNPSIPAFNQQALDFSSILGSKLGTLWSSSNSLFTFWFGVNDVNNTFKRQGMNLASEYKSIIESYFNSVEIMYKAGMRNALFLDVPPIDRSPQSMHAGPVPQQNLKNAVLLYNSILISAIARFTSTHTDCKVHVVSAHELFSEILHSPSNYGFKDILGTCPAYAADAPPEMSAATCKGTKDEYFWANELHPTSHVHGLLAAKIVQTLSS